MLGFFEKRHFEKGERIWLGRYKNLTNVLHWHLEPEIIRIVVGKARIKIGDACFEAMEGDCFFCAGEQLHYIISQPGAQIDIIIFAEDILADITGGRTVALARLPQSVTKHLDCIKKELHQKAPFYREALENHIRNFAIEMFRSCQTVVCGESISKKLITKIHNEFSYVTFTDAVRYSGYSPSHFSKMFKRLTGLSFSEYLNSIKVEKAVLLLRERRPISMTALAEACGFSTVRNFNRVFKKITGHSPSSLPVDFIIDASLRIAKTEGFDPTDKESELIP